MIDALDVISITHVWDHSKRVEMDGWFSLGDIVLACEPGGKESLFLVSKAGEYDGCSACQLGNDRCVNMYLAKPKSCHTYSLIELNHDVAEKTT